MGAVNRALELGWIEVGQLVGITAGLPSGSPGTTSLFQVQRVKENNAAGGSGRW